MLRFFRQIRQKLLENGNIRKYFWYALGEILLVMVGILLALQVNNWNEQRKQDILEERYLNKLLEEASVNVSYLGSVYDNFHERIERAKYAVQQLHEKNLPEEEVSDFIEAINSLGYYSPITPFRSIYDEVIAGGVLQTVKNDSIMFATNLFYSSMEDYSENLDYFRRTYERPSNYVSEGYKVLYDSTANTSIRRVIDFELLANNVQYVTKVNEALRNFIVFQNTRKNLVISAENMCEVIARTLEEECNLRYIRKYD